MAASSREVYLLLRARDEASRVIRGFSAELLRSASQAQAAALRAEAQTHRQTAATMRAAGATREAVAGQIASARALENQARQLELNERNTRRFAQSLSAVSSALETVGIGLAIAGGLTIKFFYDSARLAAEYQRQVALTRTQVDGFTASLQQVGEVGLDVARRIPVAFEQIQPALFDIYSSTNANLEQSRILLEGFAKAAVAGQTDVQTAARGTIAIMNAYNIPFEKVNDILDIQFELVRKGVGTYAEFASVFGRVVPSATRAGQSFQTVAAMMAFMTRNGQSAAMASTSAARALEALSHPKTISRLEDMGIKARDAKGNFLPLVDVLTSLRQKILKLPPPDRVAALLALLKGAGGTIQARRFIEQVLLRPGELEDFKSLLESMNTATGVMGENYADMADTVASKTQLLSNKWQVLQIAIGEAVIPTLLKLMDILGKVVDWFNNLSPEVKESIVRFAMIAAGGAIVLGIFLALLGVVAGLAAAFAVAGPEILVTVGVLALLVGGFVAVGASIYSAWQNSEGFRSFVKDVRDDMIELRDILVDFGAKIKQAFRYELAPAFEHLGQVITEKILPPFNRFREEVWDRMRPKIVEAFRIIHDITLATFAVIKHIIEDQVIPVIKDLSAWWERNKEEIMPLVDILIQVAKWFAIIVAALIGVGLIALFITLVSIIGAVVLAFIMLVEAFKVTKKWIMDLVQDVKDLWHWFVDLGKKIGDIASDAGDWLTSAGGKMIDGLIAGIKSKFNAVKDTLKDLTGIITSFLPHSPAKMGPLSGNGSPFKSGQAISNMLAAGMLDRLGILSTATGAVATAASPFGTATAGDFQPPPGYGATLAATPVQSGNTNYVTVTINTQEVDPRATAAELGFELAGRL